MSEAFTLLLPPNYTKDTLDQIQNSLAFRHDYRKTCTDRNLSKVKTVAGIDISYTNTMAVVAIAVYDRDKRIVYEQVAEEHFSVPYMPGYFAFRELPPILMAIDRLPLQPDAYMFDGSGILHERYMGLAAHAYAILNKPCVGVFKNHFIGEITEELGTEPGSMAAITIKGEVLGQAVRMWKDTTPVFTSPGGGMSVKQAAELAFSYVHRGGKVPLPVFKADRIGRDYVA